MKHTSYYFLFIVFLIVSVLSCTDNNVQVIPTDPDPPSTKIKIESYYDTASVSVYDFRISVWANNTIFCTGPVLKKLTLDKNLKKINDTLLLGRQRIRYVSTNKNGTELLLIRQTTTGSFFTGSLILYNVLAGTQTILRDSSYVIGGARFFKSDQECIYYSYGNKFKNLIAGYYTLNILTGKDSLFLPYQSAAGIFEGTNGFDISPDCKTLIYPLYLKDPSIGKYNIYTGEAETLTVKFTKDFLWFRYNPTGSKIVYSNYPFGSIGAEPADTSEIGIIDLATMSKNIIGANTYTGKSSGGTVNFCPDWSPDGKNIIYGSASILSGDSGMLGFADLYMITNIK